MKIRLRSACRDYADGLSDNEKADLQRQADEARKGMEEKSAEFKTKGSQIYLDAT